MSFADIEPDCSRIHRELTRFKLQRLGAYWDRKLRDEWSSGLPAKRIADKYGLERLTVEALIPHRPRKRKP